MITNPQQEDARRYLSRWVAIASLWAATTILLVVWSVTGHHLSPTTDTAAPSTVPPAVTVTPTPSTPYPTFGNPAPTRWPPVPSTTGGQRSSEATHAQPADIISSDISHTSGSISECESGRSIRSGAAEWWCRKAPIACGESGAVEWPSITAGRGNPRWTSTYCLSAAQAAQLDTGCADTLNTYGGATCVLYFYNSSNTQDWQMATVLSDCGGPGPYGDAISEQCIGRRPLA
ncbi:hypothetical protein DAVIS_02027 [Mycobacterium marinum]|uniref:Uncharacterized protein n=1 Tax=Mycobacterium marinum TaxID=1781 RepID=A0A3E2MXM4_MYCMR|nr:hypothetical protein [Mycobacterium marinum]RFZ42935.1 hypothetical protein DAVIS_02027 [Mycobacterium marinum]